MPWPVIPPRDRADSACTCSQPFSLSIHANSTGTMRACPSANCVPAATTTPSWPAPSTETTDEPKRIGSPVHSTRLMGVSGLLCRTRHSPCTHGSPGYQRSQSWTRNGPTRCTHVVRIAAPSMVGSPTGCMSTPSMDGYAPSNWFGPIAAIGGATPSTAARASPSHVPPAGMLTSTSIACVPPPRCRGHRTNGAPPIVPASGTRGASVFRRAQPWNGDSVRLRSLSMDAHYIAPQPG